jgi:putative membrane protein
MMMTMTTSEHHKMPPHLSLASGLLMGGADAVPGVSGGTIALIIGIYDRFIDSLSSVVRAPLLLRSRQGRADLREALGLLVPLGIGVLASYYLVTRLLVGPKDQPGILLRPDTAPICFGFFFGLVLVSLREPWRRIKAPGAGHVIAALAGFGLAFAFVGLPHRAAEPALWMLALGGAGAIAVMLLPGVSGSLLLVILGQYATVAGAVHDRNLIVLVVFAAGMVVGVLAFVPVLRYFLHGFHDLTMAALTGLMAGSLRALWPYKNNYEPKAGPMENIGVGDGLLYVILAAMVGGAVVWLLARLERRILAVDDTDEAAGS